MPDSMVSLSYTVEGVGPNAGGVRSGMKTLTLYSMAVMRASSSSPPTELPTIMGVGL